MLAAWRACRARMPPRRLQQPGVVLTQTTRRWACHFRSQVDTHFGQAAAALLGPTLIQSDVLPDVVGWALVRWLFVDTTDDDDAHDDQDVKDKNEALCVLGPGLLLEHGIRDMDCPLPELCGDLGVVAQFTVGSVARRLWARAIIAAQEQPREGSTGEGSTRNAVEVVVLLRGILLFLQLFHRHALFDDSYWTSGVTLDEGGLDAFDDRFTSCLLTHPNTAVVIEATKFLDSAALFLHLLPLGPAPEDVSRSRTYQQLRLMFHGAPDSRVRCAVLRTLLQLRCPGLAQDLLERCSQETDAEVLVQLFRSGPAMVSLESFHLAQAVVDVAQRGLNHCYKRVVASAISTVAWVMATHLRGGTTHNEWPSEDMDNLSRMIARAVSRLFMSSEPGVESLLRLTAARIAADEHHHQSNGALLEHLPQELQDLIGECRVSRQQSYRSLEDCGYYLPLFTAEGVYNAQSMAHVLPACQPLWHALSQAAASRLVPDCSWQLRESGLRLLEVMGHVWKWKQKSEMQALVEEHWPFLVATLNDPVALVRLRCCHTIAELLANSLPSKQDHDRLSRLVDEGLLVLFSSELGGNRSPAPAPTAADADAAPEGVVVQALALLRQLAKNETESTEAAVQRAFVGYLACIALIPLNRQPDVLKCVLEWGKRDRDSRVRLVCAALVTTIDEHLRSHDLHTICAGLAFLVALWPHSDEDSRSDVLQCVIRVLTIDHVFPDEVASSAVHGVIQQCPDLQERVSATLVGGRRADL